jgi:hypothetical protein
VSKSVPEYFEFDVLPDVKHFTCDRYRATLSVQSCSERWTLANEGASDERQDERRRSCRQCPQGALHTGKSDLSISPWRGSMMCARCGVGASRLIGRNLCVSCANRQYEVIKGRNRKNTKPVKIREVNRRSVSYLTAGEPKVKTILHTTGLEEVMWSVLRDEVKTVKFGGINVHPATRALRDNPDPDFSISDDVDEAVQAAVVADMAVPASAALDVVQANPAADVEADPYDALRDALGQLERDTPVCAPSRRSQKRNKEPRRQQRQVRVSNTLVRCLQTVGALRPPAPVPQPFYAACMFAD